MAKTAKNKKYLTLEDVRVSYRAHDDSIHLSSADGDLPQGFHLALSKGTGAEGKLRELLQEKGLLEEAVADLHASLPTFAPLRPSLFEAPEVSPFFFPLAVGMESPVVAPSLATGEPEPLLGFRLGGSPSGASRLEPAPASHVLLGGGSGSGKSVVIRSIVLGALARPAYWDLMLVDLKKVELAAFRGGALSFASTVEEAFTTLERASALMASRYREMEAALVMRYRELPQPPKGVLVVVDEFAPLLTEGWGLSEALRERVQMLLSRIATLGRAAGIHLVMGTNYSAAELLLLETKACFDVRIHCGKATTASSLATLNSMAGTEVRAQPRGRLYLQTHGRGTHGQAFFIPHGAMRAAGFDLPESV